MDDSQQSAPKFEIADRKIGKGYAPYVIAEMSGNHNGDMERAIKLIVAAKEAGADAVKLQTYTADTITIDFDGPGFRIEDGLWAGRTLYELYEEASTPWEWHPELFAKGREIGITVFSTPFDATAVDFLEELDAPAYKIASFEAADLPLIERAAATGKPIIISAGTCSFNEIADAVEVCRQRGSGQVAVLHCVSSYPAPFERMDLRTIPYVAAEFGVISGLSDHTMGRHVAAAGVALGANIIEKHFTLRRSDGGPDSAFSLEKDELGLLCDECRETWLALGSIKYEREDVESLGTRARRSLYAVADIKRGDALTADNTRSIRPGFGLPPKYYNEVLGKTAAVDIRRGTPLGWSLLA